MGLDLLLLLFSEEKNVRQGWNACRTKQLVVSHKLIQCERQKANSENDETHTHVNQIRMTHTQQNRIADVVVYDDERKIPDADTRTAEWMQLTACEMLSLSFHESDV
jgi:hypothetical protein